MAKDKKQQAPIEVTPQGVLAYSWLYEKDTKFAKTPDDAQHKATLILEKGGPGSDWAQSIYDQHVKAGGKAGEGPCYDGDVKYKGVEGKEEEFAGKWLLNFKTYKTPGLVDAAKELLPHDLKIKSGDIVKIAYSRNEYANGSTKGLQLRLAAVQLIEKRAGNLAAAGIAAFDAEEGFTADADTDYGDDGSDNDGDY